MKMLTLSGPRIENFWTGEPATVANIWRYRKAAGYTLREDVDRWWRRTGVWWVLACIPRGVKSYVIIQAATRQRDGSVEPGNPSSITALQMLKRLETGKESRRGDA